MPRTFFVKSSRHKIFSAVCAALLAVAVVAVVWWRDPSGPERVRDSWQNWRGESALPPTTVARPLPSSPEALAPELRARVTTALHDPAAALQEFNDWRHRYEAAPAGPARAALVAEGVTAAAARRAMLREVIALDPEQALHLALTRRDRAQLPPEVVALLEEPVSGRGDFNAIATLPEDAPDAAFRAVRREAVIAGRAYDAFVYGRRARLATSAGIGLHGVAIDGRLALSDSPVRVLEPDETPAAGRLVMEMCAVSGLPSGPGQVKANDEPLIGADAGDRIYYLCSAGHIALLEANLYARENGGNASGATSGAAMAASGPGLTTGAKRVLFIRVQFAGDEADEEPQSVASAETMFTAADSFLRENSFGALTIQPFITPVYTLPQTADWYKANDSSGYALNILQAARAVSAEPGATAGNDGLAAFNYLDYDFEVVRYSGGPGTFSGQAYVGVRGCWLKNSTAGILTHELGHNLGLWHANYWEPSDPDALTGTGRNREYGDIFSTMGTSKAGALHFNTAEKAHLGWLPEDVVDTAFVSGTHRIHTHDLGGTLDLDRNYALRVPRDDDRTYWFEFRQHSGWAQNAWLQNGLGVRWDSWTSSNGGTQLLDSTSGSADGKNDSAIALGRTYSDPVADIHVTPLRKNGTTPESLEVDVQIGPFPGNRAPTVQLSATASSIAIGASATLTATATDPDGDELAYAWDFGDRMSGTNTPSVPHQWTKAGDYRVRVTASDRKGATAMASLLVRVGAATGARISGTVRDLAGNPVADARVATSDLTAVDLNYHEAFTDADGTFTLTGVAGGNWALAATKPGWALAPASFANPLSVAVDASNVDFLGQPVGWRVTGVVRFADGRPVVGALVSDGTRTEPTGPDGAFAFVGVPLGTDTLQATAPGAQFAPVKIQVAYGDTVVPTITEISGAPSSDGTRPDNTPPMFTQAASVSGALNRAFVQLTARASDDRSAALVRYTWELVGPAPGLVGFSPNRAHAAGDTVARFSAAGVYSLRATATDAEGASTTSDVSVDIQPVAVQLAIVPAATTAIVGEPVTLAVEGTDQFGGTITTPAGVSWSVNGGGTITPGGVFTPTTPGIGFVATARLNALAATGRIDVGHARGPGYGLTHEMWLGLSGGLVRNLTGAATFPSQPEFNVEREGPLEFAVGESDEHNYGQRLRGFFVPPVTGDYVFRIASSNASELWLSTSSDPVGRTLIASAPVATGFRQWNALSSQRSAAVRLTRDTPVYLEVLHKAGSGENDHLSVGVELPGGVFEGPIPAHRLLPWGASAFGAPRIVLPARAAPSVIDGELAKTLSVFATSDGGEDALVYTWGMQGPAPGPVVFLPNGTNTARNTTARFAQPGRYTLQVTVTDAAQQSATSSVDVIVLETIATWRRVHFTASELADPAQESSRWGIDADPDGDGTSNLLEYAFDLDPFTPETGGLPRPTFVTVDGVEYLAITFHRNPAANDVVFVPQASSDLQTWSTGLILVGDPDAEEVIYRDVAPAATFAKRFVRVEVTVP